MLPKWINEFRMKPYIGPTLLNPFLEKLQDHSRLEVGDMVAHDTVTTHLLESVYYMYIRYD